MNVAQFATRPAPAWWNDRQSLLRFVADFVHAELGRMRHGSGGLPALPWPAHVALDAGLGMDSLERYALVSALAAALGLPPAADLRHVFGAATLEQLCQAVGRVMAEGTGELSFNSSGSTGVPKRTTHRLDLLWQEAEFFAALFPQVRRICSAVPSHHIYGFLFTILLPLACRPAMPASLDLRCMVPAALRDQLAPGDLVVAYPEVWAALADALPGWPAGVDGVTSTAPCPAALARRLADAGLPLTEVYGSSETAGVGYRRDARLPYALLPYWERVGDDGMLRRRQSDGTDLHVACQDRIAWRDERHFVPGQRHDHAVQVAGVNVYPAQIAALLTRHPGVQAAQVRLMRPDEGNRLKAFVVPARPQDAALLAQQLAQWVRARLPAPARPVVFTLGAALPVGQQGKPADWIIVGDIAPQFI